MKTKSLLNIGKFMRILKVSLLHNWNMYLDARLDISICIFIPKLTTFQKMLSLIFREARIFRQKIWILQSVSTLYAKPWYSRKLLTATGNIKITISMLQTEKSLPVRLVSAKDILVTSLWIAFLQLRIRWFHVYFHGIFFFKFPHCGAT